MTTQAPGGPRNFVVGDGVVTHTLNALCAERAIACYRGLYPGAKDITATPETDEQAATRLAEAAGWLNPPITTR